MRPLSIWVANRTRKLYDRLPAKDKARMRRALNHMTRAAIEVGELAAKGKKK